MNKQIDEMKSTLHQGLKPLKETYGTDEICSILYNAGYRKRSDTAREIFVDLEEALDYYATGIRYNEFQSLEFHGGLMCAIDSMFNIIAELKKKYGVEEDG